MRESDAALWRDKLTLLLESTAEGIYGIDLEGRCTFINRAGAQMLGYTPEQVLHYNMQMTSWNRALPSARTS